MPDDDRFSKRPDSAFTKWLRDTMPADAGVTQISSEAHRARLLYNCGFSKTALVDLYSQILAVHESRIRDICEGRGRPGDSIEERKREIEKARQALDELNGLPDDE